MLRDIDVIAWGFEGVLNKKPPRSHFNWLKQLVGDPRMSWHKYTQGVFSDLVKEIMVGKLNLMRPLELWAHLVRYPGDLEQLLQQWFKEDARPDGDVLAMVDRLKQARIKQILVTNNEPLRTKYIENCMGFDQHLDEIFASGRMGVAKPDQGFYRFVTESLEVPPDHMLLIDSHEENVEAARDAGWKAVHLTEDNREKVLTALAFNL